jgi:hypothetical protein
MRECSQRWLKGELAQELSSKRTKRNGELTRLQTALPECWPPRRPAERPARSVYENRTHGEEYRKVDAAAQLRGCVMREAILDRARNRVNVNRDRVPHSGPLHGSEHRERDASPAEPLIFEARENESKPTPRRFNAVGASATCGSAVKAGPKCDRNFAIPAIASLRFPAASCDLTLKIQPVIICKAPV